MMVINHHVAMMVDWHNDGWLIYGHMMVGCLPSCGKLSDRVTQFAIAIKQFNPA